MPRIWLIAGQSLTGLPGVQVWSAYQGEWDLNTDWKETWGPHNFYEVFKIRETDGSYWVPTSTNPPQEWKHYTELKDGNGDQVFTSDGQPVYRPRNLYIWIPEQAIGPGYKKQISNGPQSI